MTEANARHHLSILKDQGLVEIIGRRTTSGKGRPACLFSPSEQALGHNLDLLASSLLDEVDCLLSPEQKQEILKHIAKRLDGGAVTKNTMAQRLYHAVQHLNEYHYQARWEAHLQAPRVILGHCPYAAILPEHPELCQMDGFLLEALLNAPVRQAAKLSKDTRGAAYCMFQLG
jgi:predicted ArsR family transcriptional regulator